MGKSSKPRWALVVYSWNGMEWREGLSSLSCCCLPLLGGAAGLQGASSLSETVQVALGSNQGDADSQRSHWNTSSIITNLFHKLYLAALCPSTQPCVTGWLPIASPAPRSPPAPTLQSLYAPHGFSQLFSYDMISSERLCLNPHKGHCTAFV